MAKTLKPLGVRKDELGNVAEIFEIKTLSEEQIKAYKNLALEHRAKENAEKVELKNKIIELENEITLIKAELDYNRGDISKERYEELCGLKM